jgi:hypothetical protein
VSQLEFRRLPVEPDQGLPQAFSCLIGGTSYEFALYANLDVADEDPPQTVYDLGSPSGLAQPVAPPGYLVLRVVRQGPAGPQVVLLRKLLAEPGLVHDAGELAITLTDARVARGNLNGPGHYGTQIVMGVAQRWA